MRTRLWLVLAALLIPAMPAHADEHRADLYWALSYAEGSGLWGLHESFGLPLSADHTLSMLGDFSVHFGSHDGNDVTRVTYLVGPRYTRAFNPHKVQLHILIGGVRTTGSPGNDTNEPAIAFGGSWEVFPSNFLRNAGAEMRYRKWGIRVQADYVVTGGDDFPRVSGGITYRIPERKPAP